MCKSNHQIKIVEYQEKYAAAVAEMWNESSDNWGGFDSIKTEETVLQEERNTNYLKLLLAMDRQKVVGYCSVSEYSEDEGASYIHMLNVSPDYHGKKIGKSLVLESVKLAYELGYPRIDLYTWSGNTKAVPLYKKCGFFWEDRDDTTHLMNFIPSLLKTEALKKQMTFFDWYQDAQRDLAIKPDGRKENGFDFYKYQFKKQGQSLRVEFCRRGRGLRLIETDDYLIEAIIDSHELIFGKNYQIEYHVQNKSKKTLAVEIKGYDDKNIKFSFNSAFKVENSYKVFGQFQLDPIKKEPSVWKTHPCVSAVIKINEKTANFKLGIIPKAPAKLNFINPQRGLSNNPRLKCTLNIENNFDQDAEFIIDLPSNNVISFATKKLKVVLAKKEKKSLPISCIRKQAGVFNQEVSVQIAGENKHDFKCPLCCIFYGFTECFGGETTKEFIIVNGSYSLSFYKETKDLILKNTLTQKFHPLEILRPELGKPFSNEFVHAEPLCRYYKQDNAIVLEVSFVSNNFKNVHLQSLSYLYGNGVCKQRYKIINQSKEDEVKDLYLQSRIYTSLDNSSFPYKGEVVKVNNNYGSMLDYWDGKKLTENWLFSDGELSRSVCWEEGQQVDLTDWEIKSIHSIPVISPNSSCSLNSFTLALGTFNKWQDLQNFANQNQIPESRKNLNPKDHIDIQINNGNPMLNKDLSFNINDFKNCETQGQISFQSEKGHFSPFKMDFLNHGAQEDKLKLKNTETSNYDFIQSDVDLDSISYQQRHLVFPVANETTTKKEIKSDSLQVDNGVLRFKSIPSYGISLTNLYYKGHNWFESGWPKKEPKYWWNPFLGGINLKLRGLSTRRMVEEKVQGALVEMRDSFNNPWEGIKNEIQITKDHPLRGMGVELFYLTLKGTPILCFFARLKLNTGHSLYDQGAYYEMFFNLPSEKSSSWFQALDENLNGCKFRTGSIEQYEQNYCGFQLGMDKTSTMVTLYTPEASLNTLLTSKEFIQMESYHRISGNDNSTVCLPPLFLIFTEEKVQLSELNMLKNIKF